MVFKTVMQASDSAKKASKALTFEKILGLLIIVTGIILIQGLLVMYFWNVSLPRIFPKVPCITYGQAIGLSFLTAFLFG